MTSSPATSCARRRRVNCASSPRDCAARTLDPDGKGGIYVSSWTQGKVWKLTNNGKKEVLEVFKSAADFYLDRKAKKLIVPDMLAGGTLIFVDIK